MAPALASKKCSPLRRWRFLGQRDCQAWEVAIYPVGSEVWGFKKRHFEWYWLVKQWLLVVKGQQWILLHFWKIPLKDVLQKATLKNGFEPPPARTGRIVWSVTKDLETKGEYWQQQTNWLYGSLLRFRISDQDIKNHQDKVTQQFTNLISPKFADKMHGLCCLHMRCWYQLWG